MVELKMRSDTPNLNNLMKAYPQAFTKAYPRAINKTMTQARNQAVRSISKDSQVKVKEIKDRTRIKKSKRNSPLGVMWLGTIPLPATAAGKPKQQKKGAKAGKHKFPGAFVAKMPSGYEGVFERQGVSRFPLEMKTIDLGQRAGRIFKVIGRRAMKRNFPRIFKGEMSFALSGKRG